MFMNNKLPRDLMFNFDLLNCVRTQKIFSTRICVNIKIKPIIRNE